MSDRFLEKPINITFCVKLGKNACGTCATLSEAVNGTNSSNRTHMSESQMKTMLIIFFSISRLLFALNLFHKANQSTELITWKY
jgi:hypothetical protein